MKPSLLRVFFVLFALSCLILILSTVQAIWTLVLESWNIQQSLLFVVPHDSLSTVELQY